MPQQERSRAPIGSTTGALGPPRVIASPLQQPAPAERSDPRQILEDLFRRHHQSLWRTLRRLGSSQEAAADYTQQAFVIAAERFEQIRPGSEKAFLFATAIGLARTNRRRDQRCQLEQDMDVHQLRMVTHDRMAQRHYARQLVDRILSQLDPDIVTVFALFELEGFSGVEIAELLDLPQGTVASRLRRARTLFRAEVARMEKATHEESQS